MSVRPTALALALALSLPALAGTPLAPVLPLAPHAAAKARAKTARLNRTLKRAHQAKRLHLTARQWLVFHNPVPTRAQVRLPVYPGARLMRWGYDEDMRFRQVALVTTASAPIVLRWYQARLRGWRCQDWVCRPKGARIQGSAAEADDAADAAAGGHGEADDGGDGVHVAVTPRVRLPEPPATQAGLLALPHGWRTVITLMVKAPPPYHG